MTQIRNPLAADDDAQLRAMSALQIVPRRNYPTILGGLAAEGQAGNAGDLR